MIYDDWDVVALVFFLLILGGSVLFWMIVLIDRKNPLNRTRRVIDGRRAMASDWRKPQYLPEDWR